MGRGNLNGLMEGSTMGNGQMASSMGLEFLLRLMESKSKVNGKGECD